MAAARSKSADDDAPPRPSFTHNDIVDLRLNERLAHKAEPLRRFFELHSDAATDAINTIGGASGTKTATTHGSKHSTCIVIMLTPSDSTRTPRDNMTGTEMVAMRPTTADTPRKPASGTSSTPTLLRYAVSK